MSFLLILTTYFFKDIYNSLILEDRDIILIRVKILDSLRRTDFI